MSTENSDIKQIIETISSSQVNKYLERGWVLLETASGQDECNSPLIKYSLGHTDASAKKDLY